MQQMARCRQQPQLFLGREGTLPMLIIAFHHRLENIPRHVGDTNGLLALMFRETSSACCLSAARSKRVGALLFALIATAGIVFLEQFAKTAAASF
jgi:hypothetical protein